MNSLWQKIFSSLLIVVMMALLGCSGDDKRSPDASPTNISQNTPAVKPTNSSSVANSGENIKFKLEGESAAFTLKFEKDGAKLVDANDQELARFKVDSQQKLKIKNSADQVLGYVVTKAGYWKLENAEQSKELYVLRRQADGDYKLEDGANKEIYRIKARDYGWEIETPTKKSIYKVKIKDNKLSLRNAADRTVFYTKSKFIPVAIACFGFDVLTQEQKAALAYTVNQSGGK